MATRLARVPGCGFVGRTPLRWLNELPRYLKGITRRLERLENNPAGDAQKLAQIGPLWRAYKERLERISNGVGDYHPDLEAFHWGLEEFRISLFAQELGTRFPVSAARLEKRWRSIQSADGA